MSKSNRWMTSIFLATLSLFHSQTFSQELPIESTHDVIVVGAGNSGLSAGYYLRNHDVKILERNDHTGGSAVSQTYEGITYPVGKSIFAPTDLETMNLFAELNLDIVPVREHSQAFLYDGATYFGLDGLTFAFKDASGYEDYGRFYVTARAAYFSAFEFETDETDFDRITAKEWFDREHFAPLFYQIYDAKARLAFAAGLDEISAKALLRIIYQDADIAPRSNFEDLENDPEADPELSHFFALKEGEYKYLDAITDILGDKIQLNANVESVVQEGDWSIVTYTDLNNGTLHTLRSKAVVLAVPANIVGYLAPEILSEEQKTLLGEVKYSSLCAVSLYSEQPIFDKAYDLQFTDESFITDSIDNTWILRNEGALPEGSNVRINSAIVAPTSYLDQSFKQFSDEEIVESVYADLEKIDPDVRSKVTGYQVRWLSNIAPVRTVGSYERLERLREITNGSLALAGSYVIDSDFLSTIQSGRNAAEQAIRVITGQSFVKCFELY